MSGERDAGVVETFDRLEELRAYLRHLPAATAPPMGKRGMLTIGELPEGWLDDYLAAAQQLGGKLAIPPRLEESDGGQVARWAAVVIDGLYLSLGEVKRLATPEDLALLQRGAR